MNSEAEIRAQRSNTFNRVFPGPLTDAQRRFFTLRDSGYTGWINQDGYAVSDPSGGCVSWRERGQQS